MVARCLVMKTERSGQAVPTVEIPTSELFHAVQQLSLEELNEFALQVLDLRNRRIAPSLSATETGLFQRINAPLPPPVQHRYDELIGRRRAGTLTLQEHAELLQLTAQAEENQANRIQALA